MALFTVFGLCTPRDDVIDGSITESDFAANLARVLRGDATPDYLEPKRFFANTYPTEALKDLLANVCGRLSGRGAAVSAVFRLGTSFGGGKTHGLIALVHADRGMQGVSNIAEFVDPAIVPTGTLRIAAFDGENADAANGRPMGGDVRAFTPWGEIAYQLVQKSDQERVAPGSDTLRELFGNDPVLIVLDELGEYLRKVQHIDGRNQLTAFMKALFTAIDTTPKATVVYTLAVQAGGKSLDAFAAENEFLASAMLELESVSGRKTTILNPSKDDETAKVIRRRIFSRIDDAGAGQVIEAYKALWNNNRDALSEAGRRPSAVEEFMLSYPFHPDVLDTFTSKTATLANSQRVRGMLCILAKTVGHVWAKRPPDASAIHLHHIDLANGNIRSEFTTRLQQSNYLSAVKGDIATIEQKPALATELDARHYKGLLPYTSYVARTAFVHTLALNNELKGIAPDHLRFSILNPAADITFIDDARQRFRQDSAYLDDRPNAPLRFNAEANLTQVIAREEQNVDKGAASDELRDRIKQIFGGSRFDLVPFASGPYEVPDDISEGKPRLVLVSHDALEVGAVLDVKPPDPSHPALEWKGETWASR
jgi:predicted AAA+ superfamily ATPase